LIPDKKEGVSQIINSGNRDVNKEKTKNIIKYSDHVVYILRV